MRVLMFGWEFPPHIAGGLGTACYGMTKGLAHCGVDVLFVMPSASGDEDQSAVRIINASDVAVYDTCHDIEEFLGKVQFLRVGSNLHPYGCNGAIICFADSDLWYPIADAADGNLRTPIGMT